MHFTSISLGLAAMCLVGAIHAAPTGTTSGADPSQLQGSSTAQPADKDSTAALGMGQINAELNDALGAVENPAFREGIVQATQSVQNVGDVDKLLGAIKESSPGGDAATPKVNGKGPVPAGEQADEGDVSQQQA